MTDVKKRCLWLFGLGLALAACKPSVGQAPHLVTGHALLAVRGEPPEAKPGASVTFSFLLASPTGTVGDAQAWWSTCETPKPPSESNAVASACTGAPDAGPANVGQVFVASVPTKACQLFGPIAPPLVQGQPPVRPRDPDNTGGYYLPVQLFLPDLETGPLSGFALERITCGLANAPSEAVREYNSRYAPNLEPGIDRIDLVDAAGARRSLDADLLVVAAGTSVTLEVVFADGAAEWFPTFDPVRETLVEVRETLSLSWFVTAGEFEHDRTGLGADETAGTTTNRWTAPSKAGIVHGWIVLRDSRGGTAFRSYQVEVVP